MSTSCAARARYWGLSPRADQGRLRTMEKEIQDIAAAMMVVKSL